MKVVLRVGGVSEGCAEGGGGGVSEVRAEGGGVSEGRAEGGGGG